MKKYGERKWEISKVEQRFECTLTDAGFSVLGLKEYSGGFTDYLIEKDGISIEYRLFRDTKAAMSALLYTVMDIWDTKNLYLSLQKSN